MSSLANQIAATQAYLRILTEADECSRLYRDAGIEMPELLKIIVFGDERENKTTASSGNVMKRSSAVPGVPIPVPYRP
jgi:hypothetical protein